MASNPSRRRHFIIQAVVAKRDAANDSTVFAVPPAGRFDIRISGLKGDTVSESREDGTIVIHDARLFLADGSEIDGAAVVVDDAIADDVRPHLQFCDMDVKGEAVVTDVGYRLVSYHQPDLRQAA